MKKIQQLASEYNDLLICKTRTNGDKIICLHDDVTDNHPLYHIIKKAHGDLMPDDFIFDFVAEALCYIANNDDLEEVCLESDAYNHELLKWAGSNAQRIERCDEIIEECGSMSLINIILYAQIREKEEVFFIVKEELEKLIEDSEEE